MAKVEGVFAGIRGKVGNVIFQVNKGVQILKQFATPENPRSAGQTAHRGIFTQVVGTLKVLATNWVRYFWNPFLTGNQQGWGRIISLNMLAMGTTFDENALIFSVGSLEGVLAPAATYNIATGEIIATFTGTIFANGLITDKVSAIVYDKDQKEIVGFGFAIDQRDSEEISITVKTGLTATNVMVFLSLSDTDPSAIEPAIVSDSQLICCTASA